MAKKDDKSTTSHDQNFKNLILDYPRQSLRFFAAEEAFDLADDVAITPVRQEQLKDRLGDRFHGLDTPLQVEWPDGSRAAVLFVAEEETEPGTFSIHRICRYCVHLSELMKTSRVVPVAIFLRAGEHPSELTLSGDWNTYLFFRIIACDLKGISHERYMTSTNIVARLNLPNMAYPPERKLDVYASAREALIEFEPDPEKRRKYSEFIDIYADLDENDIIMYKKIYLPESGHKEEIMGLMQKERDEGRQEGRQEGAASTLRRLLSLKFQKVPVWAEELLKDASQEDLDCWTDRVLVADAIEEVFQK